MMPSAAADPYYVAKEEVEGAIKRTQEMHNEWKRLLYSENTAKSQRFQTVHTEISGDVRQLDFDLQDIEATIKMVEDNRARFQISEAEIGSRKGFVSKSRGQVREMQASLSSSSATSKLEADKRQVLLAKQGSRNQDPNSAVARQNQGFLEQERQSQAQIIRKQDETLDQIASSAARLQQGAQSINLEIKEQQKMLEELDEDIVRETEKLNFVMKRIGRLLQTGDNKQICLIIALFILMIVLIFLVINA